MNKRDWERLRYERFHDLYYEAQLKDEGISDKVIQQRTARRERQRVLPPRYARHGGSDSPFAVGIALQRLEQDTPFSLIDENDYSLQQAHHAREGWAA